MSINTRAKAKNYDTIVIRKYANRRLYDTGRSSYVTLEDLCEMIHEGQDFVVVDAKSNEDLTQSVLTQIIVEQEAKGEKILPCNFLRQLIRFYGDTRQAFLPEYLERSMRNFVQYQETMEKEKNPLRVVPPTVFPEASNNN